MPPGLQKVAGLVEQLAGVVDVLETVIERMTWKRPAT